jgi:hypothetical protein
MKGDAVAVLMIGNVGTCLLHMGHLSPLLLPQTQPSIIGPINTQNSYYINLIFPSIKLILIFYYLMFNAYDY